MPNPQKLNSQEPMIEATAVTIPREEVFSPKPASPAIPAVSVPPVEPPGSKDAPAVPLAASPSTLPTPVPAADLAREPVLEKTEVRQEAPPSAFPSPSPRDDGLPKPGQMLGRCRVEKLLGRGGMGAVFLARHATLDIPVAVKVMLPNISRSEPEFAERFMREAKLASRIRHANVIQVMDAECDPRTDLYYIVQEFIDGGTVRNLIRNEGTLSETRAIDITIGVAEALVAAAEYNIVHRDIKPENIMLNHKGEVKLADLGIAKECGSGDDNLTVSQVMMGTPAYLAPEQARDAKNVDARADIYSLGATLYHMLCGEPPHTGDTTYSVIAKLINEPTPDPGKKRPDLSKTTSALVMRMIDKNRDRRPKNAKALLEELLAAKAAIAAKPAKPAKPAKAAMPARPVAADKPVEQAEPTIPEAPSQPVLLPALKGVGDGLAAAANAGGRALCWLGRGLVTAAGAGWRALCWLGREVATFSRFLRHRLAMVGPQTWRRLGMGLGGTAMGILLVAGIIHLWQNRATSAPPIEITPPVKNTSAIAITPPAKSTSTTVITPPAKMTTPPVENPPAKSTTPATPPPATPPPAIPPPATPPPVKTVQPPAASGLGLAELFKGKTGVPDLTNKTCYLRVNLFWDKEPPKKGDRPPQIDTLNLHHDIMLVAGTEVIITKVNNKEITFTVKTTGISYTIKSSSYAKKESLPALQHRYFAEQNPLQTHGYQHFTQVEKDAIKNGQIVSGMNKEAVLMAYGYPPNHATNDLAEKTWIYWIKGTRDKIEINFENDRVVAPKSK